MASVAMPAAVSSSAKGYSGALPTPPATMSARLQPSGGCHPRPMGPIISTASPAASSVMCSVPKPSTWYIMSTVPASASAAYTPKGRRRMWASMPGTFTCTNCPGRAVVAISGARTVMSQMLHPISSFTRMGAFSLQSVIGSPVASAGIMSIAAILAYIPGTLRNNSIGKSIRQSSRGTKRSNAY